MALRHKYDSSCSFLSSQFSRLLFKNDEWAGLLPGPSKIPVYLFPGKSPLLGVLTGDPEVLVDGRHLPPVLVPSGHGNLKTDSNSKGVGDAQGAAHWTRAPLNYQASLFQSRPTPRMEKPQYKANRFYVEGTL